MKWIVGEPIAEPFHKEGCVARKRSIEVTCLNVDGQIEKTERLGYIEEEDYKDIYSSVKMGEKINLNYSFVRKLSIASCRSGNSQENVKISKISAVGAFFDGDIDFNKVEFGNHKIDFSYSKFHKGFVNFGSAKFGSGDIDFSGAQFWQCEIDFLRADFGLGNVDFIGTNFGGGYINFCETIFGDGDVNFRYSNFGDANVNFGYAQFGNGDVVFGDANFGTGRYNFSGIIFGDGEVNFRNVQFKGGTVDFTRTVFGNGTVLFGETDFGNCDIIFSNARFGNSDVDFSYSRIGVGDFNFKNASILSGKISFNGFRFADGAMDFRGVSFNNCYANFAAMRLKEVDLDFSESVFEDCRVDFIRSRFGSGVKNFESTYFGRGKVSFSYSDFEKGKVNFSNTTFDGSDVDFSSVRFLEGDVSYSKAKFGNGNINFENSEFRLERVDFSNAVFGNGTVNFQKVIFGCNDVSFDGAIFNGCDLLFGEADFMSSKVDFINAEFGIGNLDFHSAKCSEIQFIKNTFCGHVDMRFNKINAIRIEDCIIEKTFDMSGISNDDNKESVSLSLYNTKNLGQMYIDWEYDNVANIIYRDNSVQGHDFCKINIQGGNYKNYAKLMNFKEMEIRHFLFTYFKRRAMQFRLLKENFRSIGQYEDEDKAYIEYKRCERKTKYYHMLQKKHSFTSKITARIVSVLEWVIFDKIGGYGTRPYSVLISMFATILSFSLLYYFTNMIIIKKLENGFVFDKLWGSIYHSMITFFTIGYGDTAPKTVMGIVFSGIEGFFGVFLMSYFTVAFARKVLR